MIKRIFIGLVVLTLGLIIIEATRLLTLSHDRKVFSKFWQEEAARPALEEAFIYVALGDSAAQGLGASHPLKGYVGLVASHIEQQTGKPVHIINLSVSGARVEDIINQQIPKLTAIPSVDLVTIDIGANNVASYKSEEFRRQFTAMTVVLPAGTVVANIPSFRNGRRSNFTQRAIEVSAVVDNIVAGHKELKLADLQATTGQQGLSDFAADLFHPNNKGYKNWAKAFIEALAIKQ